MSRWLLPLVAVLALCGRTVTAFAAAGWVGKLACCCPDARTCKCHDHDGKHRHDAQMKRCGAEARLVAPDVPTVAMVTATAVASRVVLTQLVDAALPAAQSALLAPPEPPPI